MTDRFMSAMGIFRVRKAVAQTVESLEPRAYLTGFVLGSPNPTATAPLGLTPYFANLAPFVTANNTEDDLFIANQVTPGVTGSTNSVSVLLSTGNGFFDAPVTIQVPGKPLPLQTADFNGDGNLDIVAGTTNTGSPGDISIILGNGDGTFQAPENIPALGNNNAIAVGAFIDHGSGAGNLDVITVSNNPSNINNAAIVFVQSALAGKSGAVVPLSLPFGSVSSVATGDFNGDGHLDFAVLNQSAGSVSVFLGNGDGSFKAPTTYVTGPAPTSLVVGQFRGPTKLINGLPELDIVTADSTGGEVSFLANKGDGTFAAPVNSAVGGSPMGGGPLKVRLSNLNGDSNPDLICLLGGTGATADATAMLGNGDGTFHTGATISAMAGTQTAVAAGDLKGTGLTDIVLTNTTGITSLLNITNGDVMPPTAVVTANPPAQSTSLSTYQFTVTYSDVQQVDAISLSSNNLIVTAPAGVTFPGGGTTEPATLVAMDYSNGPNLTATYSITFAAPLSQGDVGAYQVALNPDNTKVVTNAHNVPVAFNTTTTPMGLLGTFNLSLTDSNIDAVPPVATVDTTQLQGSTSVNYYQFNVTYTDNVAVKAATITGNNLIVQFPDSSTQQATLVPGPTLSDGQTIHATYQITFPANLAIANDGPFTVFMQSGTDSVTDTSGNAVTTGTNGMIGTFNLVVAAVAPPAPKGDFILGPVTGKFPLAAVAGITKQGGVHVKVFNSGANGTFNGTISGTVTIALYASTTNIVDSNSILLTSIAHKVKNFKVNKSFNVGFKQFKYPTTAGMDFLVANASINGSFDSSDGATAATIKVAPPFVSGTATVVKTTRATLVAGKRYTAFLTVQNTGNIASTGSAPVTVSVTPTGGTATQIGTATPHVHIQPGKTGKISVSFIPANLPTPGTTCTLTLSITIPGDTLATAQTSVTLLTISA